MKKSLIITLLLCVGFVKAQISTTKMNDLRIGMTVSEVEKLTQIKITNLFNQYNVTVKGIAYKIAFAATYKNGQFTPDVLGVVMTSNPSIKTLSGIGVGSNLDLLWNNYHKYNIDLTKGEQLSNSKQLQRFFTITDQENATKLQFELVDGQVKEITVQSYNPEECTF